MVEQWAEIITTVSDDDLAKQLLGDLPQYRHGHGDEAVDRQQIVNLAAVVRSVAQVSNPG